VTPAVQDGGITAVTGEPVFSLLEDLPGQELELGLVPIVKGEAVPPGCVSLHGRCLHESELLKTR
jgi:hypothetical protein